MHNENLSQILMQLGGRELLFMHFLVLVNSIGCFLSPSCFQISPQSLKMTLRREQLVTFDLFVI